MSFRYRRSAQNPVLTLEWEEQTGDQVWTPLDLTGGTFSLTIYDRSGDLQVTKTTGITGADGSVEVQWGASDLDLASGRYAVYLRETTQSRDYEPLTLEIYEPGVN